MNRAKRPPVCSFLFSILLQLFSSLPMYCKKGELVIKTQIISKKAIFAFDNSCLSQLVSDGAVTFGNWRRLFYGRSAEAAASFVENS